MGERLFVAIWPPAEVVAQVNAALPPESFGLRWQPCDRWHITLAFLGERGIGKEQRRFRSLAPVQPGELRLAGAGAFGAVVWVGVDAGPLLEDLARRCQQHFDTQDRRFQAHVTVARARSAAARAQVPQAVAALNSVESAVWLPEEVTLVRSTLGPNAAYEVIGRQRFERP